MALLEPLLAPPNSRNRAGRNAAGRDVVTRRMIGTTEDPAIQKLIVITVVAAASRVIPLKIRPRSVVSGPADGHTSRVSRRHVDTPVARDNAGNAGVVSNDSNAAWWSGQSKK